MQSMIASVFSKLRSLPLEKLNQHEFNSTVSLSEAFTVTDSLTANGNAVGVRMSVPNPEAEELLGGNEEKVEIESETMVEGKSQENAVMEEETLIPDAAPFVHDSDTEGASLDSLVSWWELTRT